MLKIKKTWQIYSVVAIALLTIDWLIGIARFHYSVFKSIFTAINFPVSIGYLWLERQTNSWWHGISGTLVGDEIGQFITFFLMVALQSFLITMVFILFRRWRSQDNVIVN